MKKKSNILLASSSKRRLSLLKQIRIFPDKVVNHSICEDNWPDLSPEKRVKEIAYQKALSVKKTNTQKFIISADTIIIRGKNVFEKTNNIDLVKKYLTRLSGRKHFVLGGICVIAPNGNISKRVVKTEVFFKKIGNKDLHDQYLLEEGRNKAGGYAIQGYASCLVSKIKGSYSNVVGLSIYHLLLMLKGLGWSR